MSQITQIVLITTGALRHQRKIVASVLVGGAALAALLFIGEGTSPSKAAPASAVGAGKARPGNGLIVFMRPGEIGAFDVWVVRPDDSHLRRVTKSPKGRDDHNPVWSPDGSTILFERRKLDSSTPGPDEAIYAVNANGKDLHQVTHCHGHCWSDSEPAYSRRKPDRVRSRHRSTLSPGTLARGNRCRTSRWQPRPGDLPAATRLRGSLSDLVAKWSHNRVSA